MEDRNGSPGSESGFPVASHGLRRSPRSICRAYRSTSSSRIDKLAGANAECESQEVPASTWRSKTIWNMRRRRRGMGTAAPTETSRRMASSPPRRRSRCDRSGARTIDDSPGSRPSAPRVTGSRTRWRRRGKRRSGGGTGARPGHVHGRLEDGARGFVRRARSREDQGAVRKVRRKTEWSAFIRVARPIPSEGRRRR